MFQWNKEWLNNCRILLLQIWDYPVIHYMTAKPSWSTIYIYTYSSFFFYLYRCKLSSTDFRQKNNCIRNYLWRKGCFLGSWRQLFGTNLPSYSWEWAKVTDFRSNHLWRFWMERKSCWIILIRLSHVNDSMLALIESSSISVLFFVIT